MNQYFLQGRKCSLPTGQCHTTTLYRPKKASLTEKFICKLLPLDIFALSLRNPNYSKFIHIERYKCKPLQQHIVITKLSLESSYSYPSLYPLSPSFSSIHTYTLTHAQTVGQWDYEGEGDHLSQSAVMIVYQRLEEWSGSRWWKQAL